MPADTKAMGLLIRMVPLMRREFGRSLDTNAFFTNAEYSAEVLKEALHAKDERLAGYARELRLHLQGGKTPTAGLGVRNSSAAPTPPPAAPAGPPSTLFSQETQPPGSDDPTKPGVKRYVRSLR